MTLTEIYFNRIFNDILIVEGKYRKEDIRTIQIRAAATYLCFSLYLVNKAYNKSWSIKSFRKIAGEIVWNVLDIKRRPYKFKVVEAEEYHFFSQDIILEEACRLWKLGYKFLSVVCDRELIGEAHWFNYWSEQIRRYENEDD